MHRPLQRFIQTALITTTFLVADQAAIAQGFQPGLTQIGVSASTQALGNYGAGVKVGIFDTPIDESHIYLNVTGSIDLHANADYVSSSHGTHVAGTIGGSNGYGVAPLAKLIDISVLSPSGSWASGVTLRRAMDAAHNAGVTIANMSFGYPNGYTLDYDEYSAIKKHRDNILVVKAAGNDGIKLASVKTPKGGQKKLRNLMLVGSVDADNQISEFSNRPAARCFSRYVTIFRNGQKLKRWRCRERDKYKYFFIVAPGENVRSTTPGNNTGRLTGTSMATPHVAGAAALLQGRWAHLKNNPVATANILFHTADDLGSEGVDNVYGWGLLNVERAFQPIGETYLNTTKKKYPSTSSRLRGTGRLERMIGWNSSINALSVFDDYDRDFSVSTRSLTVSDELRMGERLSGLLSSSIDPAFETINTSHTFAIGDAILFSYNVSTTREKEPDLKIGIQESGLDGFLSATTAADPLATWNFSMRDTTGTWSVSGGSKTDGSPFAFTGMQEFELAGLGSGENIENPVLGLIESGNFIGSKLQPIKGIEFAFGHIDGNSEEFVGTEYDAAATMAGLKLTPAAGLDIGITLSQLSEDNGFFTAVGSGGLSLGDNFRTQAVTLSANYRPNDNWLLTAAYSLAQTTQRNGTDLLTLNGSMFSDASAIAISHMNLMARGDRLSLTASLPLATISGSATSKLASHLDANGNMIYREFVHELEETNRPIEFSLGYSAPLGWGELSLGAIAELNARTTSQDEFGGFAAYKMDF